MVIEQILVLLFRRLTTPLYFGAVRAKMAPEIRSSLRRKNINFPVFFTNQFFYDIHMAIVTLDHRLTDGFNRFFIFGERREQVEVKQESTHIKFPTYSNVIFSKVRLFIFDLKPLIDSPSSSKRN